MIENQPEKSDAKKESFLYLMDILKMEIDGLDKIISRMDEMAQSAKNWTITIWTGSLAITLSQPDLRKYVIVTAVAPLLFWYIDAYVRHLQRRSIFRGMKISEFLNSPRLVESFEQNQLVGFAVSDSTAIQYRNLDEYKRFVSRKQTFRFPEVATFYAVLAGISILMGVIFLVVP